MSADGRTGWWIGVLALLAPLAQGQEQAQPQGQPQDQQQGQQQGQPQGQPGKVAPAGLEDRLQHLEEQQSDDYLDLADRVDQLEEELAEARAESHKAPPQSLGVFNPGITVFGNFLVRSDDRKVFVDDDPTEGRVDDRASLREVEVDFRAPIDPWADGVVITTFEAETPGDFQAGIEEGYVVLKKLPGMNSAPGGLKLKLGRFRPSFGRLNVVHLHDLPQVTYSDALGEFLGPEGYIADGASGEFFLPSPSEADSIQATVAVLNGGGLPADPNADASQIALSGRVKWFRDVAAGHDVEAGLSTRVSDTDHQLYGADLTYRWKPFLAGEWRSFLVGLEAFLANNREAGLARNPAGLDAWTQYQFNRNWYAGLRLDWTQAVSDSDLETWTAGAFVTYYTTEFLRLRLGYEHAESDVPLLDGRNTGFFELNFVFGSHPVEPYWVNR